MTSNQIGIIMDFLVEKDCFKIILRQSRSYLLRKQPVRARVPLL